MDPVSKFGKKKLSHSAFLVAVSMLSFILLASILGISYFTQETDLYKYFNSDALTIFSFLKDILHSSGHFSAWHFSNAPSYFPDFLIALVASIFSDQAYFQIYLSALIQTSLLGLSIKLLAETAMSRASLAYSIFVILLIVLLALKDITPYYQVLILNWHFGTYLGGLFYLWMYANWVCHEDSILSKESGAKYLLLLALCFLSFALSLSDALFIPLFSGALMGVGLLYVVLRLLKISQYALFFGIPFCFSVLGTKLSKTLVPHFAGAPLQLSGFAELSSKLKNIADLLFGLKAPALVIAIFFFLVLVRSGLFVINALLRRDKIENFYKSSFFVFFCLASLLSNLIAILGTNALVGDRYMPSLFFAPFVFFYICVPRVVLKQQYVWGAVILLLGLHLSLAMSRKNSTWKDDFYPSDVACIDRATSSLRSPSGIAEYWLTKRVVTFSHNNVRLVSVKPDLTPYHVLISNDWYRDDYNFAIINTSLPKNSMYLLSEDLIVNFNGKPTQIEFCNDLKILLYPQGLNTEMNPLRGNGIFTIQGCNLPQSTGSFNQSNVCSLKSNNRNYSGNLSYGPYLKLDPGQYEFRVKYASANPSKDDIGHLDVSFLYSDRHEVVSEYKFSGTDSQELVFKRTFSVDSDKARGKLEIRTFILPNTEIEIFGIEVEKLKP